MEEKELIKDKNELTEDSGAVAALPEQGENASAETVSETCESAIKDCDAEPLEEGEGDAQESVEEDGYAEPSEEGEGDAEDSKDCDAEHATELEELSLDSESAEDTRESAEESAEYESFFAEYSTLMAERLKAVIKSEGEQSCEDTESEGADGAEENGEDEVIILGEDIEFHSDIVEKSERKNAEDHIRLVPEKALPEELPADIEEHTDEECESQEEADETDTVVEVAERPVPEPEQMEIDFSPKPAEKKRDRTVYDEKNPRVIDYVFDALEMIAITLLAAIIITSIFFRFSFVDGHSMDKTLANGDTLLISDLFYTPDYNDIVVIEYETNIGEKKPLIKRVIGLEGDKIRVTEQGEVYRNDELLDESEYVYLDGPIPVTLAGEWTVGEGELFVMGDHRNDSKDSRDIGPVSTDAVIGRAIIRIFPLSSFGIVD